MSETAQHTIVLVIVGACVGYILWQVFGTFFARRGKLGSCCATGCDPRKHAAGGESAGAVHFLPVDSLSRTRKQA